MGILFLYGFSRPQNTGDYSKRPNRSKTTLSATFSSRQLPASKRADVTKFRISPVDFLGEKNEKVGSR
jgi:hypothetical protein